MIGSTKRMILTRGCAIAALCAASGVWAQEVEQVDSAVAFQEPDIVVTAQKRAESKQDVPMSISVLDARTLEELGASSLTDYAGYVPGLNIESQGGPGQSSVTLRGIVDNGGVASVAIYVDETPFTSSADVKSSGFQLDMLPYDIQQIEILRGPQGTIYGANALGGVIKYTTVQPHLTELQVRAGGEIAGVSHTGDTQWGVRASVSVPLIKDRLAIRASYYRQEMPGFIDNIPTGQRDVGDAKQEGGRIALLWEPSDAVSVRLTALLQNIDQSGRNLLSLDWDKYQTSGEIETYFDGRLTGARLIEETYRQRNRIFDATINWDLGWANLVSATAYSEADLTQVTDATRSVQLDVTVAPFFNVLNPFPLDIHNNKFTQEIRLASAGDQPLEWLVGAFYTREKLLRQLVIRSLDAVTGLPAESPFPDLIPSPDPFFALRIPGGYKEYAAFANLNYRFSERFEVSGGVRFARNDQDFEQINLPSFLQTVQPSDDAVGESSDEVFTFSFSPQYHFNDNSMVYFRAASGYRPGGPNPVLPGVVTLSYDPDRVMNYEAGFKTELMNRRLVFDVAAFRVDWKDIQITVVEGDIGVGANGGRARSQGFELSTLARPLPGLELGFNAAYTDAKLLEDVPEIGAEEGARIPNTAKWAASATASYEFPIFSDWSARMSGGYRYVGSRDSGFAPAPGDPPYTQPFFFRSPSYNVVDLQASISNERITARIFAKNITDERAILSPTFAGEPGADLSRNVIEASVLQPRTIGVSLDVRF